jgi:hypothetical protein
MTDKFNTTENQIVAFLDADSDIYGLVNLVHAKLKEDQRTYYKHEIPAIGVQVIGYQPTEDDRHEKIISCIVEVTSHGGDVAAVDNVVKQIASLVIDKLDAESPYLDGGGISNNFEDIICENASIIPGWLVGASIEVDVTIKE